MAQAHLYQTTQKQDSKVISEENQPKWGNSPITYHEETLMNIRHFVPDFERRPFTLPQTGDKHHQINKRLDTIVRKPFGSDQNLSQSV